MSRRVFEHRWPWLVAAVAIALALLSTVVEIRVEGAPDPRPVGSLEDIPRLREREDLNVLFILIDTLRADHLGMYGYERDTSSELDRVAATGVRFARHLSQSSWTKCSMASLWTGLYPARTGVTRYDDVISEEARMPAEILREAGFRTVGLYRNGWVAPTFGFEQGFEVYMRPAGRALDPSIRQENPTATTRGTDQDMVDTALEFVRVQDSQRWFLYLHLMDVHEYTYDADSAVFGGGYSDIYDNAIHWVDRVVAMLLRELARMGHADDTLVVITSDHGEAFRERGYEGHAREVFKETTEVPLVLSFPFKLEPGIVVERRTRGVDLWPTLLDLLGLETPPGLDGRSLVPLILASGRGEAPEEEPSAVAHLDSRWGKTRAEPLPTVAVADGPFRYVRLEQSGQMAEQLFDARRDPRELEDLAPEEPEELEKLRTIADAYLETAPPWGKAPTRDVSEMELNQLRALGYALP